VEIRGYRSSNSDTIANRRVEPFDFLPDYAAVWCYDTDSRSCKQFRISRMENVVMLPAQWQHREQHKLPFCDAFGMAAPMPADTIKLALSLKAYNLLLEEHPTAGETVTTAGSSYTLEIPVANYYGVGRFVLGLPGHIKVLGSAAFVSFLQEEAKKVWRGDGG
jgi:predicted DNA-binding transcriptional regulator YafY